MVWSETVPEIKFYTKKPLYCIPSSVNICFAKDESIEHNLNFLLSPSNLYTDGRRVEGVISNVFASINYIV